MWTGLSTSASISPMSARRSAYAPTGLFCARAGSHPRASLDSLQATLGVLTSMSRSHMVPGPSASVFSLALGVFVFSCIFYIFSRHHIWPPPRFAGVWKTSGPRRTSVRELARTGWPSPRCRHLHAAPAALMPNQQLQFWASVQERGWSRPRCASPPRGDQPPLVRRPAAPGNATKCDGDRF